MRVPSDRAGTALLVALLAALLLPSCFTLGMWHDVGAKSAEQRCDGPITADEGDARLYVPRATVPEVWLCHAEAAGDWLVLTPRDHAEQFATLLAAIRSRAASDARCGVTLDDDAVARVHLEAWVPDAAGVRDLFEVDCDCDVGWCETRPAGGVAMTGAVRSMDWAPQLMPTWTKVVLSPFTAVLDLATLPLQGIAILMLNSAL